jgi:hypothetical protein
MYLNPSQTVAESVAYLAHEKIMTQSGGQDTVARKVHGQVIVAQQ